MDSLLVSRNTVFSNPLKIGAHIILQKWYDNRKMFSNPLKIGAHIMTVNLNGKIKRV